MNKSGIVLMGTLLGLFVTAYASAEPEGAGSPTDKISAAKTAEMKGDLARIHKNYDGAVYDYLTALHSDPADVSIYNKLGITELQLHDHGLARKYFKQALKYDPRNSSALNNMGAIAYLDRKYNPAIKYYKQALALDETNAAYHLNIAEAWISLNQIDRGMTEYARALELNADILTESEDGVVAQVKTPEQRARISYFIAKAYAKRGNVEGALEYLQRSKDGHFPDLARVYTDQEFAPLWQDPRLAKIVKRPS
jgi:tetratricopeptide (TPR) repeat protein